MRRTLTIIAILLLLAAGICAYRWFTVSPEARTARPYAQRFAQELRSDARFAHVNVGVWDLGSKGPLYIRGTVSSDSDTAELRQRFDALHCPVGVSWQITVQTNQPAR